MPVILSRAGGGGRAGRANGSGDRHPALRIAEILRSRPPHGGLAAQNDRRGEGGVRIEDMVVIENGKARVMSHAPKLVA